LYFKESAPSDFATAFFCLFSSKNILLVSANVSSSYFKELSSAAKFALFASISCIKAFFLAACSEMILFPKNYYKKK